MNKNVVIAILSFIAISLILVTPNINEMPTIYSYVGSSLLIAIIIYLILDKWENSVSRHELQFNSVRTDIEGKLTELSNVIDSRLKSSDEQRQLIKSEIELFLNEKLTKMHDETVHSLHSIVDTGKDSCGIIGDAMDSASTKIVSDINEKSNALHADFESLLGGLKSIISHVEKNGQMFDVLQSSCVKSLDVLNNNMSGMNTQIQNIPQGIKRIGEDICDKLEDTGKYTLEEMKNNLEKIEDVAEENRIKQDQFNKKANEQIRIAIENLSESVERALSTLSAAAKIDANEKQLIERIEKLFKK